MTNEEFMDFYKKYFKFSTAAAYQIIKDRDLAEDISQDVFYKLYAMGDKLDLGNERKSAALVRKATVRKAIDYRRKKTMKSETTSAIEEMTEILPDERASVEAEMLRMEANKYYQMVLERFRIENQMNYDILIKVKYLDISPDEVAKEYGITRNNVNNRILRAKKWIADELSRVYGE